MNPSTQLSQNIDTIQSTIVQHSEASQVVNLVAVTKTVSSDYIRQLHQLGLADFAENRPAVFLEKLAELSDIRAAIQWHFIGHLQSRQVKQIINEIDYLHSLDRMSLAKEIQKRADRPIRCFLQVNVSGEASKGGFRAEEVASVIDDLAQYDKIQIIGLMTMAPIDADDNELHDIFRQLKVLQQEIAARHLDHAPCTELSMGMSQDYPIAIEEGATYIRVGSALFAHIENDS